jgi:ABC-type arginine transport system ATPase subunit
MLSGGERQMLSLGSSLMARPSVLLLDELSAALAPRVVEGIADAILGLRDLGLPGSSTARIRKLSEMAIGIDKAVAPMVDRSVRERCGGRRRRVGRR